MKRLKVFYMGQRLRDVYPHATRFEVLKWRVKEFLKKVLRFLTVIGLSASLLYGVFMAGAYLNPIVTYAVQEKLIESKSIPPVMERIAKCESSTGHFSSNGQVQLNANTNKTVDIGKYQINEKVWGATATKLGFNLFNESDNEAFAMWLYENEGTEPWYSSVKCWR